MDIGHDPLELFHAFSGELPARDAQDLMAYPLFSLAKSKRKVPIDFRSSSVTVRVEGTTERGLATIWDADILICHAVFSEQIVSRWIRLEWLRMHFERIYDGLCRLVQTTTNFNKDEIRVRVLNAFGDYETGKGYGGITLSAKIFARQNPSLSVEWAEIRKTLKL